MSDTPRVLGQRYEVGDLIGRGGMAQVHLGYDTRLSRTVAIKILRTDLAQDPMFLARFRREAQSAAALNHPSIVSVYDTGEEQVTTAIGKEISLPYIVMEFVKGRTVASLLADGNPVPIGEAIQITVGVLSALQYSHHEGIIHRDIKPGNVMLTPDGKVKVMDFGIARAIADSAATMTQTNSVVGTAQYLSPEQARGEVVDARSDLYSAGCLLYELLTGQPPFTGESAVSVAYQHVSETPRPASLIAPDIPDSIDRVVMKSLAKRRDERYQSASEFHEDLLAAARGEGVDAPSVTSWNLKPVAAAYAPTQVATTVQDAAAEANGDGQNGYPTGTQTGVQPAVDEKTKRRNKAMIWIGVIFLLLAAAGIIYATMFAGGQDDPDPTPSTTQAQMVEVPSLDGMNQDQVHSALANEGLEMQALVPENDDTVPEGEFLRSTPAPGSPAEVGSTVQVTFSKGPGEVEVPDLRGMTVGDASDALSQRGLRIGDTPTENNPTVPKDQIISSSPEAGQTVAPGSTVNVSVSTGQMEIPNVAGRSQTEATSLLVAAGFTVSSNVTEQESNDEPGTVIGTSPGAGETRPVGTEITLIVSSGSPSPSPTPTPTETEPPEPSPTPSEEGSSEG
ncbi:Stk1 family PASTA domain-containing Ser/Thr kinase [Actinomycetaceae bacterium L2_0104]